MTKLDSVQNRLEGPEIEPQGPFDLGEVHLTQEEPDGLYKVGGRKFILAVLGIVIFGIFTAVGKMDVDTYMWLFGALTASYFGINFMQKKML